jgi:hypothetical protein
MLLMRMELFSHAFTICRVDREKESSSSSAAADKVIVGSTVPQNAAAAATRLSGRPQLVISRSALSLGMCIDEKMQ